MKQDVSTTVTVERYECIRRCGWYRDSPVEDTAKGSRQAYSYFVHPLYGEIMVRRAVERDIRAHDCDTYKAALKRYKHWMRQKGM